MSYTETPSETARHNAAYEMHQLENMGLHGHGYRGVISAILFVGHEIQSVGSVMADTNEQLKDIATLLSSTNEQLVYIRGMLGRR